MAFTTKIGNLLRQTVSKHINSELSTSNPSIYQAIRCMSSSKLFVGGLSYSTDDQSLREAFAGYGEVIEARVILDRETGRSRGFGFVSFTSSEEASSAITGMDGKDLHGRMVRVNYAAERSRGGFGGGGGGYGGGYGGGGNYGGGYGGEGGNYGGGGGSYGGGGNYGGGYGGEGGNYGGGDGSYGGGGNYAGDSYGSGGGRNYGSGGGGNYGSAGSSSGNYGGGYGGGGSTGGYSGDGFGSNSTGGPSHSGGYGVAGAGGGNYSVAGGVGGSDNYAGVTGGGNTGSFGASGGAGYGSNDLPYTTGQVSMNGGSYAQDEPLEGNYQDDVDEPDDYANKRG